MIEIKKGKEPSALATYRNTPFASYENMHGAKTGRKLPDGTDEIVYDVVLNHLIKEQGGLCAYCMRKIPVKRGYPKATIEHIQPQHTITEKDKLDYRNMLAVCPGNRDAHDNSAKSCDAYRGSLPESKQELAVNPLKADTLRYIDYREDGTIFSDDGVTNSNLNDVLNLNCKVQQLAECRAAALKEVQEKVANDNRGRTATKEYFENLMSSFTEQKSQKWPYVGIIINWLESKIK